MELNTARSMLLGRGGDRARIAEPWPTAAGTARTVTVQPTHTPFGMLWAYVRRLLH